VDVTPERLSLSEKAHLIMPYHRAMDVARETAMGKAKIGTTGRGIGPCYEDKVARIGIRAVDLLEPDTLQEKISANLKDKNFYLTQYLKVESLELQPMLDAYLEMAAMLRPFITDVSKEIDEAIRGGSKVLFEGAQGTHLDVDHGTYPYVTSSNPISGSACAGAGVGPDKLHHVIGIVKAYTTRVGEGPFATELLDETGDYLQRMGAEFGSTTGRRRRCGWLDAVAINDAVRLNGLTSLAITKLDVLTGLSTLKICVAYELDGGKIYARPASLKEASRCVPVYENLPGWKEEISRVRSMDEMPSQARRYLERIEKVTGVPLSIVSVGPGREQTIELMDPFK
jgi:adenylosuccinate synthase